MQASATVACGTCGRVGFSLEEAGQIGSMRGRWDGRSRRGRVGVGAWTGLDASHSKANKKRFRKKELVDPIPWDYNIYIFNEGQMCMERWSANHVGLSLSNYLGLDF